MLHDPSPKPTFGASLLDVVRAAQSDGSLARAAETLDDLAESGDMPRRHEFVGTLCAALGYDIANRPYAARRMYGRLDGLEHPPLEHLVGSKTNSRFVTEIFAHLGSRNQSAVESRLSHVANSLQGQAEPLYHLASEHRDDYAVLLSTAYLLKDVLDALKQDPGGDGMIRIKDVALKLYDDLGRFSPDPWIEVVALLCIRLVRAIADRSVLSLDISEGAKRSLQGKNILELREPQNLAVKRGLLEGKSIVCSSPPGTGKSFMACLVAGQLAEDAQMAYLVPTRSLCMQVYRDLSGVLGSKYTVIASDRDRTEHDDRISTCDVVVATYEKMDALVRSGRIDMPRVRSVVADELQILGEPARGMAAEMMLAGFLQDGTRQMIGLSGPVHGDVLARLCGWLGADPVENTLAEARITRGIVLGNKIHYEDGRVGHVPIADKGPAKRAASVHFARRAISDGEPVMIFTTSRKRAFTLARGIRNDLSQSGPDADDVEKALLRKRSRHRAVADRIRETEPEVPESGRELASLLDSGIAYHHAGMPYRYRAIVEDAVRDGSVDAVVTTPALEAGVNMPIKTVLLSYTRYYDGRVQKMLSNGQYRNMAGRAGRPGHHKAANVFVVCDSEKDMDRCKSAFWHSGPKPFRSVFYARNYRTDLIFCSQLLGYISRNPGTDMRGILSGLGATWFAKELGGPDALKVVTDRSLSILSGYGMISGGGAGGGLQVTPLGRVTGESMVSPDTAAGIMAGMGMCTPELDPGERGSLILLMACMDADLNRQVSGVVDLRIPETVARMADALFAAGGIPESIDREPTVRCAGLLHYWMHSYLDSQIADLCRIPDSVAPVSDNLANDAYRMLQNVASFAMVHDTENGTLAGEIRGMADSCRVGSSSPVVSFLLNGGIRHVGRNSAILISRRVKSVDDLYEMPERAFVGMFPDNREVARALFGEIQQKAKR